MKSLQRLVSEYGKLDRRINAEKNIFKRIKLIYNTLRVEHDIYYLIYELHILELLKEFRIMYIGQFSNTKIYNPQIKVYEMIETNCLDIYIKYNYIIKFRYNADKTFIAIEGNYPDANKLLTDIPFGIECEIRNFIKTEMDSILDFIRR